MAMRSRNGGRRRLGRNLRRDLWMLLSLLERQQRSCDGSPQMPRQRLRSILNRFNLKPSRSNGPAALPAHHLNAHLDRRNRRQVHRACEVSASARCRQHDKRYEQYSCNQKRFEAQTDPIFRPPCPMPRLTLAASNLLEIRLSPETGHPGRCAALMAGSIRKPLYLSIEYWPQRWPQTTQHSP